MKDLMNFAFEEKAVRVVMRDDAPWFMLADVCRVLGLGNAPQSAARLDDDEKSTIMISDSGNLNSNRTVINESGLYSLVLTSRKPEAKRFKKWVTGTVRAVVKRRMVQVIGSHLRAHMA